MLDTHEEFFRLLDIYKQWYRAMGNESTDEQLMILDTRRVMLDVLADIEDYERERAWYLWKCRSSTVKGNQHDKPTCSR